jgi:hypothetical protein
VRLLNRFAVVVTLDDITDLVVAAAHRPGPMSRAASRTRSRTR